MKVKFTRQEQEEGNIEIIYVPTEDQIADGLTKRLNKAKHKHFIAKVLTQIS